MYLIPSVIESWLHQSSSNDLISNLTETIADCDNGKILDPIICQSLAWVCDGFWDLIEIVCQVEWGKHKKNMSFFPPYLQLVDFLEANEIQRPVTIRTNTLKTRRRDLAQVTAHTGRVSRLKKCFIIIILLVNLSFFFFSRSSCSSHSSCNIVCRLWTKNANETIWGMSRFKDTDVYSLAIVLTL